MDRLLTLKETGKLLNVSKQTLQRWDNNGKLIAIRTKGGHRRYKLSDIENIMNKKNIIKQNEIIESAEMMYDGGIDFNTYINEFSKNEIDMAVKNAKMYCDTDYAACAFLGFLDGILFNKK